MPCRDAGMLSDSSRWTSQRARRSGMLRASRRIFLRGGRRGARPARGGFRRAARPDALAAVGSPRGRSESRTLERSRPRGRSSVVPAPGRIAHSRPVLRPPSRPPQRPGSSAPCKRPRPEVGLGDERALGRRTPPARRAGSQRQRPCQGVGQGRHRGVARESVLGQPDSWNPDGTTTSDASALQARPATRYPFCHSGITAD